MVADCEHLRQSESLAAACVDILPTGVARDASNLD
jgi:hypothetical protein